MKIGESFFEVINMSIIQMKQVTFGYDSQEKNLFQQVSLNLDPKWKLGLVGRNGRGKTTLFYLLLNKLPYTGEINHQENFVYFPQQVKDPTQLTYEVVTDLTQKELWEVERELNLLKVDESVFWRPFNTLSGGEQTKVLLALLFLEEEYPLIDEPTNHLDSLARQQVISYLNQKNQGFIVISHNRHFLNETTDHTLAIEKSQLSLYQGNFATYEEEKQLRDAYEQSQNTKLTREISRLKQTAEEKKAWSKSREKDKYGQSHVKGSGSVGDTGFIGARSARMMKRSKAIMNRVEGQIKDKEQLLADIEQVDPLKMTPRETHHKRLIWAENVTFGYEETGLFQPLSFELKPGDRVALTGSNGSGKSTFIQAILGEFDGNSWGNLERASGLKVSVVRQHYENNQGDLKEFAEKQQISYQELLNNLIKLGMSRETFQLPIEKMSMGQRKKVELAKSLGTSADLYIWDEPLNYLDVFNHEQIEELILSVQPSLLFVEHDKAFLDKIATKTLSLKK